MGADVRHYIYHKVAGDVRVTAWGEGVGEGWDRFIFEDVNFSDVTISDEGGWLQFAWDVDGDTGRVQFANGGEQMNSFEFADGTKFNETELASGGARIFWSNVYGSTVAVTGELDTRFQLRGKDGDDTLIANASVGATNDWNYMGGGEGNDTYIYHRIAGDVRVESWGEGVGEGWDRFIFEDVNFSDVTISDEGGRLQYAWDVDGDTGRVQFANGGDQMNWVQFADGTQFSKMSESASGRLVLEGVSAADTVAIRGELNQKFYLKGGEGNSDDILIAGASTSGSGWSYMAGRGGDDTYIYYRVADNVRVSSWGEDVGQGWDQFIFSDVDFSDVTMSTANGFLQFRWSVDGDTGRVQFANGGDQMNWFQFADGTRFSDTWIEDNGYRFRVFETTIDDDTVSVGGELDDRFYLRGQDGDDVLIANASNSVGGFSFMGGRGGSDTYIYHKVAGDVRVTEWGEGVHQGWDEFIFEDVNFSDVTISDEGGWLQYAWDINGDTGRVQFANGGAQMNWVEFADGTRFSSLREDSYGKLIFEGELNHRNEVVVSGDFDHRVRVRGGDKDDVLVANADISVEGWNYMDGLEGNDIYAYHRVTGDVRVTDYSETADGGTDVFMFEDVDKSEIELTENGNWLQFRFFGGTVQFEDDGQHMEYFSFADDPDKLYYVDWQSGSPHLAEAIV